MMYKAVAHISKDNKYFHRLWLRLGAWCMATGSGREEVLQGYVQEANSMLKQASGYHEPSTLTVMTVLQAAAEPAVTAQRNRLGQQLNLNLQTLEPFLEGQLQAKMESYGPNPSDWPQGPAQDLGLLANAYTKAFNILSAGED
jgi:hypothetical protein